jgi:hypothetical protein
VPGTVLDSLLGAGTGNSSVAAELEPENSGGTNSTNQPKGFDQYTPNFVGGSSTSQVCPCKAFIKGLGGSCLVRSIQA